MQLTPSHCAALIDADTHLSNVHAGPAEQLGVPPPALSTGRETSPAQCLVQTRWRVPSSSHYSMWDLYLRLLLLW